MKKLFLPFAALALLFASTFSVGAVEYPVRSIQNIIPFSAGGGTDMWNRTIMDGMGRILGQTIISSNMTGGAGGSIAVDYSWKQKHDGYTLCGSSDGMVLIPVMSGMELTTKDWHYFVGGGSPCIMYVSKNCKYKTMEEILEAVRSDPGSVSMGGTGAGLWYIQANIIMNYGQLEFQYIPYDGTMAAIKGAIAGEVDTILAAAGESQDFVRSGDLIPLAVLDPEPWSGPIYGDMEPITKWLPSTAPYFPIRQWLGFMVPLDTDPEIVAKLSDAFHQVMASDKMKQFAEEQLSVIYDLSGDAAKKWVGREESNMTWLLYEMGQAKFSPADFGIPKIER